MASVGNRQNLTPEEAALAVTVFNNSGRVDPVKTQAANDKIFHANNVVTTVISGSIVKDVTATVNKAKTARTAVLAELS